MKKYYELHDRIDASVTVTAQSARNLASSVLCSACHFPLPSAEPVNIEVESPLEGPLGYVNHAFLPVVSFGMLEILQAHGSLGHLTIGDVTVQSRKVASGHTIWGLDGVLIRGSRNSNHHLCPLCRRIQYTRVKSSHVTAVTVEAQHDVYCADPATLLVSEEVKDAVLERYARDVRAYFVPTKSVSDDGLAPALRQWLTPDQVKDYVPNRWKPPM